jgi:hypothetical protein
MMIPLLKATDWVQCSVHSPNPFICTHRQHLLPSWRSAPQSVIIILQRSLVPLSHCTAETERQKNVLRDRFIHIGNDIRHTIQTVGYDAELFDPKSGYPLISSPGSLALDDVAVACQRLRYAVSTREACTYLLHPQWKDAVYPSTIVSDAPVDKVKGVLPTIMLPDWYRDVQPVTWNHGITVVQGAIAPTLSQFQFAFDHLKTLTCLCSSVNYELSFARADMAVAMSYRTSYF